MSNNIVLQKLPEFTTCRDILDGVCVLRSMVEQFFNTREFKHESLADMIPCDFQFRVGNAVTTIPSDQALPEITMTRSDVQLQNINPQPINGYPGTVAQPGFSLIFEIKTPYYKMTEMMCLELGEFLLTFTPFLHQFSLNLAGVTCGQTKLFRESTPNYYFAKVTVNASVPLTVWTYKQTESILRSIVLSLNIRGGDNPPTPLN